MKKEWNEMRNKWKFFSDWPPIDALKPLIFFSLNSSSSVGRWSVIELRSVADWIFLYHWSHTRQLPCLGWRYRKRRGKIIAVQSLPFQRVRSHTPKWHSLQQRFPHCLRTRSSAYLFLAIGKFLVSGSFLDNIMCWLRTVVSTVKSNRTPDRMQ